MNYKLVTGFLLEIMGFYWYLTHNCVQIGGVRTSINMIVKNLWHDFDYSVWNICEAGTVNQGFEV